MKRAMVVAALLMSAGCTSFENNATREYSQAGRLGQDTRVLITTADARIVIARERGGVGGPVVCTEPSPDVAKALSTETQLEAKGGTPKANGDVGFATGSAETAAELAGRSTALLALRDGLFHTCEAYANGALGADAYALVLARYGQLMTTLFLAQDATTAISAATTPRVLATSPTIDVVLPNSNSSQSGQSSQAAPASSGGTPKPQSTLQLVAASASDPPAAAGSDASAPSAQDSTPQSASNSSSSSTPASAAAIGAISLARMNEDYFDLDRNLLQVLLVACINHGDPTRADKTQNSWLTKLCEQLDTPAAVAQLLSGSAASRAHDGRPGPAIDPVAIMVGAQSSGGGRAPATGASNARSADPSKTNLRAAQ